MSRWINETEFLVALVNKPRYSSKTIGEALDEAPSIDIVRCKECRFYDENDSGYCDLQSIDGWKPDDFCSYGCRDSEKPNNSERSSE